MAAVTVSGQALSLGSWSSTSATAGIRQVQAATLGTPAAPTASQVAGGRTVLVSWSAAAVATSYEVRHWTVASGGTSTLACTSAGLSCVDPTARSGASHWYSVVGRIGSQWVSESTRTAYTADDSTSVTITSLTGDSGTSSADFVTRTASTTLVGTAEVGASIAVRRSGTTIATATANGSGAWTSTAFSLVEGAQTLDAVATDAYANTASASQATRLDTVVPIVSQSATCAAPGNAAPSGLWCRQTTLSMSASFSDAGSGLAAGTSQYDDNGGGFTTYTGAVSLAQANGRVVQVRATDVAGNTATASTTYYIDGTAPSLTITAPSNGLSVSLAVLGGLLSTQCGGQAACGTASDATSGLPSVASVTWELKKGAQCYVQGSGFTTCGAMQAATGTLPSWTTPMSGIYAVLSSYTLTVDATDAAGNTASAAVSFSTLL